MATVRAGVVGAGTMGAQIAATLVLAGCDVVLQSRRPEARERFRDGLSQHYDRAARRGRVSAVECASARARARTTGDYHGFGDREVVIEAVAEDLALKGEVVRTLEAISPPRATIASTTSSFPIAELAALATHPQRILGLHFFNPVRFIRLVEVVATSKTTPERVTLATDFVTRIGMVPLRVRDGVGFLVNRLLFQVAAEGCRVYTEHAATPAEIDEACLRWGMLVGPCAMLDMVGLDVALAIACSCATRLGPAYAPPRILERLVAAGRLGRKAGCGLYAYPHGRPEPDPALDALLAEDESASGPPPHTRFRVERLLVPMVNEALACLADEVASAPEIDLAMTETTGMRYGPLAWCRHLGPAAYLGLVDTLAAELGPRFALRPHLAARVRSLDSPATAVG